MPTYWATSQMSLSLVPFSILACGPHIHLSFTSALLLPNFSLSLIGGLATALLATSSRHAYLLLCWEACPSRTSVWVSAALQGQYIKHSVTSMVLATTQLSW